MIKRFELLEDGVKRLGISADGDRIEKIRKYLNEIELWNPKYSLVSEKDDLVSRHVLDSLAAERILKGYNFSSIADIGSGAGFPGIPLAIWMENIQFTLIEKSGKRADFLRNVKYVLKLDNVNIVNRDASEIKDNFDCIVFRALCPLTEEIIKMLTSLTAENNGNRGIIAAYKGRKENIVKEIKNLDNLSVSSSVIPLEVPFLNEERNLLLIKL